MSDNVFRFSVKKGEGDTADKLIDLNAVEEVVRLSKEAAEVGKSLEQELAAQDFDIAAQNGLKNFIREQIEATQQDGQTRHVQVMDEDALADLIIEKGAKYVDVKCESYIGKDNWSLCKDLGVIYINGDQPDRFEAMKAKAIEHGIKRVESTVSKAINCEELSAVMHLESKITGNPAAVFFPHAYNKAQATKLVRLSGVASAKAWAQVGGAVALGSNFVDVITGEKTVKEAAKDVATSAVKGVLIDYAKSQIIANAVAQPVVKAAIKKAGGKAALKALGQTQLGSAGLTAVSSAEAVVGGAAKSFLLSSSGLVVSAINGVGGTAAGVLSSVGLTSGAGLVSAGTAGLVGGVGAAVTFLTPLAPVAIGGAAIYGIGKLLKKIF